MNVVNTDGLDDYNPFTRTEENKKLSNSTTRDGQPTSKWPLNETSNLLFPKNIENYKTNSSRPEAENGNNPNKLNNWPPFPVFLPCKSCLYQDISREIPEKMQSIVTAAYYVWIWYSISMIFNVFGTTAYFISLNSMESGSTFGTSVLMLVLLPVIKFLFWFRPLYKAARSDSSIQYFIFFLAMFVQIVIVSIQSLGIDWLGSCGWINGLVVLAENKTSGIIMLFVAVLFTALLACHIILLIKVHGQYRNAEVVKILKRRKDDDKSLRRDSLREIAVNSLKYNAKDVLEELKHNQ